MANLCGRCLLETVSREMAPAKFRKPVKPWETVSEGAAHFLDEARRAQICCDLLCHDPPSCPFHGLGGFRASLCPGGILNFTPAAYEAVRVEPSIFPILALCMEIFAHGLRQGDKVGNVIRWLSPLERLQYSRTLAYGARCEGLFLFTDRSVTALLRGDATMNGEGAKW